MAAHRDRLERALARIEDKAGEGARAFITVMAAGAREAADAADARAKRGLSLGPLDGTIVSVKDLFDVAGERTTAGAKLFKGAAPAKADCPAVARLRAAGAVIIGKTNLSEFAFHAIGTNPHFGTPGNAHDRSRAPGGSSSGAAISVTDGMAEIGLGSDTAGSIRIPASLNGIVGFKPTQKRVPLDGAFPLSYALDSAGPLTGTVASAHAADSVLAGERYRPLDAMAVPGLRLLLPKGGFALSGLDDTVGPAFAAAIERLAKAGARLVEAQVPILDEIAKVHAKASFSSIEAQHIHRDRIGDPAARAAMDPVVVSRIDMGKSATAVDYIEMCRRRAALIAEMDEVLAPYDALIMPTTAIVAPPIAEVLKGIEAFVPRTLTLIRNTVIGNFFDLCSVTLPIPSQGLPVGLMLTARHGHDARLFEIAAGLERFFAG